MKNEKVIVSIQFIIGLIALYFLIALTLQGPVEASAGSTFEYYLVIVKLLRFGFISVILSIFLIFTEKLKK
jgi:hypothetical protein